MIRIRLTSAIVALAAMVMSAYAQAPRTDIIAFEPLDSPDLSSGHFELSIFGRQFNVTLERNDSLLSHLPVSRRQAVAGIELWKGELEGLPESWVRITRRGSYFSGAIWDGADLFLIEPHSSAASQLPAAEADPASDLIVFQLSRSSALAADLVLHGGPPPEPDSGTGPGNFEIALAVLPLSPVLEIDIGLIADVYYNQFAENNLGSEATIEMLTVANVLDGIYLPQVGIRIRVTELITLATEAEGFTATDPAGLLYELSQFKGNDPALAPLAIAHLITGRELQETGDYEIIGIAHFSAVCDSFGGVSLTQGNFFTTRTAFIAAHEIAHNLGAPHDAETDSVCEAAPSGLLMDPIISENDEFSQCSIDQMHARLLTATCARAVPETDVSVTSMGTRLDVMAGWSHSASFLVSNDGLSDALGIEVVIETSPEMTIDDPEFPDDDGLRCEQDLHTKTCTMDILPAGDSVYVNIRQTAVALGTATTTATATTANDADSSNNVDSYVLEVLPAVELSVVDVTRSTNFSSPGRTVDVTIELLNSGLVDATDVSMSLWLPRFFELESIDLPPGGSCSATLIGHLCEIMVLPAGESQFIDLQFMTSDLEDEAAVRLEDDLRVRLVAAQADANEGQWWTSRFIAVPVFAEVELGLDAPSEGTVGEIAEFTFSLTNQGPDTIPSMHLNFSNTGMAIDTWDGPGAACTIGSDTTSIACDVAPVAAGETRVLAVSGVAPRRGEFTVVYSLSVEAWSPDPADNADSFGWSVVSAPLTPQQPAPDPAPEPQPSAPPASSGGGGGGGSLGPLSLLLLLVSTTWNRRLRRSCPHNRTRPCGAKRFRQWPRSAAQVLSFDR